VRGISHSSGDPLETSRVNPPADSLELEPSPFRLGLFHSFLHLTMLALRATALLALASSSVGQILGLDIAADVAGLVTAVITPGSSALIDLNLLAGLLSPADVRRASVSPPDLPDLRLPQCPANAVVGLQSSIAIGSLLKLCLCVTVIGVSLSSLLHSRAR
jgi:hypothetical protein